MSDETDALELVYDTRPLDDDDLVEEDIVRLQHLQRLLLAMSDEVAAHHDMEARYRGRPAQYKAPFARPEAARTPRVIMLDGARGTGKTSLLLTLLDRLAATRGHQGQPAAGAGAVGSPWMLPRVAPRLWAIPPLDLDPLPPGMPLLGWIVQAFRPLVSWLTQQQPSPMDDLAGTSLLDAERSRRAKRSDSLDQVWQELFTTSLKAWAPDEGIASVRYSDLGEFAQDQRKQPRAWHHLHDNWRRFIDRLTSAMEHAGLFGADRSHGLIVVPVDDVDMQVNRAAEAVRVLRHLYHRRVVFLLTGHIEHLESVLSRSFRGRYNALLLGGHDGDEQHPKHQERRQARFLVDKVIPEPLRIPLRRLTVSETMAWRRGRLRSQLEGHPAADALLSQVGGHHWHLDDLRLMTVRELTALSTSLRSDATPTLTFLRALRRVATEEGHYIPFTVEAGDERRPLRLVGSPAARVDISARITRREVIDGGGADYKVAGDVEFVHRGGRRDSEWFDEGEKNPPVSAVARALLETALRSPDVDSSQVRFVGFDEPLMQTVWTDNGKVALTMGWYGMEPQQPSHAISQLTTWRRLSRREGRSGSLSSLWLACNAAWATGKSAPPEEALGDDGAWSWCSAQIEAAKASGDKRALEFLIEARDEWVPKLSHPAFGLPPAEQGELLRRWLANLGEGAGRPLSARWCQVVLSRMEVLELWTDELASNSKLARNLGARVDLPWAILKADATRGPLAWFTADPGKASGVGGTYGSDPQRWVHWLFDTLPQLGAAQAGTLAGAVGRLAWRKDRWAFQRRWDEIKQLGGGQGARVLHALWQLCWDQGDEARAVARDVVRLHSSSLRLLIDTESTFTLHLEDSEAGWQSAGSFAARTSPGAWLVDDDQDDLLLLLAGLDGVAGDTNADWTHRFQCPPQVVVRGRQRGGQEVEVCPPPLRNPLDVLAWWALWSRVARATREQLQSKDPVPHEALQRFWLCNAVLISGYVIAGVDFRGGKVSRRAYSFPVSDSDLVEMAEYLVGLRSAQEIQANKEMAQWLEEATRTVLGAIDADARAVLLRHNLGKIGFGQDPGLGLAERLGVDLGEA